MTKDEILAWYESDDERSIWGYMYGTPTKFRGSVREALIEWTKKEITLGKDSECFIVRYGWPGPDFNIYKFIDYGKTWAFSIDEIDIAWGEAKASEF